MDILNKFSNGVKEIFSGNQTELQGYTPFNNHDIAYLIGQSFLLLLTFVAILWIITIVVVLRKHRIFHVHLITLMINMLLSGLLYFLCKIILTIEVFICNETCYDTSSFMLSRNLFYVDFLKIIFGCAYFATLPGIINERAHATVKLKIYEKEINYWLIFNILFFQYFFSLFFSILMYKEVISMLFLIVGAEVFSLAASLIFFAFDRINQQLYKESTTIGNTYELCERYQLAENIKTSKMMKHSILTYAIFNANLMIMFYLVKAIDDPVYKKWIQFAYELEVSIYAFVLPLTAILSVETWKNVFIKTFKKFRPNVDSSDSLENLAIGEIPVESLNHITSSKGEKIVFKLDQEAEIYFNQLMKAWN